MISACKCIFFKLRWSHKFFAINKSHVTPSSSFTLVKKQMCVLLSSQVVHHSCVSFWSTKGVFMMGKQRLRGKKKSGATPCGPHIYTHTRESSSTCLSWNLLRKTGQGKRETKGMKPANYHQQWHAISISVDLPLYCNIYFHLHLLFFCLLGN